jgi:hypothetical protein
MVCAGRSTRTPLERTGLSSSCLVSHTLSLCFWTPWTAITARELPSQTYSPYTYISIEQFHKRGFSEKIVGNHSCPLDNVLDPDLWIGQKEG